MRAYILSLLVSVGLLAGCSTNSMPDPLVGFHIVALHTLDSNKMIADDYKTYIQSIPSEDQKIYRALP